jgi:hypothetical protein
MSYPSLLANGFQPAANFFGEGKASQASHGENSIGSESCMARKDRSLIDSDFSEALRDEKSENNTDLPTT